MQDVLRCEMSNLPIKFVPQDTFNIDADDIQDLVDYIVLLADCACGGSINTKLKEKELENGN